MATKQNIKINMGQGNTLEVEAELFTHDLFPNRQLAIHKKPLNNKYYSITDVVTGRSIEQHASEKSKKATLEEFNKMLDRLEDNKKDYMNEALKACLPLQEHVDTFNKDMELINSISIRLGFTCPIDTLMLSFTDKVRINVIQLDKLLNVQDGTSTSQHIENLYGKELLLDVKKLI